MTFTLFCKMVAATIMALFTAIGGIFMPVEEKEICMIGHRGYSGIYHENTELAFVKAVKHGSGGCETDVRITKDGVFVLSHNSDVELSNGETLVVAESTYEELSKCTLKRKNLGDVYICTLQRYLEIMRDNDMVCFIELKGEYTDQQIKDVFALCDKVYDLEKCILQSFDFDNLIRARKLVPDLPIMLTWDSDEGDYRRCFEYNFSIDADYRCVTEEMVKEFHDRGLQFAVWTCNDLLSLEYSKSLGVDYIESDLF